MKNIMMLILCMACVACSQINIEPSKPQKIQTFNLIKSDQTWQADLQRCPTDVMANQPVSNKNASLNFSICEKNIDYCVRECKKANGQLCYAGAVILQTKLDKPELGELMFMQACKHGITSGCTNSASYLTQFPERLTKEKATCALATYEKTCELSDPWGCTMSGKMHAEGDHVKKDMEKAQKLFNKSCIYGKESPACRSKTEFENQYNQIDK